MFNQPAVTSSWGQPQQPQQQNNSAFGQPSTSAFGQAGFGAGGGGFGQQQQPQPQVNPMFGGLATPANNNATQGATGFGAFGANTANTGTGAFGQPKPATGFGAFGAGGGSAFGGGGTFGGGANTSTSGAFGAQNANAGTSAFGGSAFGGAKPVTSAFGTTTVNSNPNAGPYDGVPPVTTGTSNPPYSVFIEADAGSSVKAHYQSITCIPQYRGCSFEELRWQDYQQNRKTAAAAGPSTGAFGQSAFGQPAQPPAGTGLFGQPAAQNATQPVSAFGAFGGNTNQPPAAGTGGFGAFGQTNPAPTGTGTGLFGGSAFGQQPQQQQPAQTGAFGAFGQPQQPQQQQQQQPAGGLFSGGAFGNNQAQNKPFGSFGTTNTTSTTGTTGGFGAFGQPSNTATPGTGLFGQQQQQQQPQQQSAFGSFGQNNNAPKPSIFAQPTTGAFGSFGTNTQNQQQQQQAQPAGGLFANTVNTGGGLFGNNQNQNQQQQPAGGLFGGAQTNQQQPGLFANTGTGGGLFGAQNQNQQQPAQSGFGLFGAKPATTTQAGGGLFGGGAFGQQPQNNAAQTQPQSSLFATPVGQSTQPSTGGFNLFSKPLGTTQPANQQAGGGFSGGLFGGSSLGGMSIAAAQNAQQPSLTASIAQPVGANLPIFSMLPPGPRAIDLDQPKKKTVLFSEVPTRSPMPRLQLGYAPAASKLRGFGSTGTIPGANGGILGATVSLTNGKPGALSLSKAANKSLLGPDSFLNGSGPSAGLGSGSRPSVKKLVLDKKIDANDLFGSMPKVTFNPALSIAARELEAATAAASSSGASRRQETPAPAPGKASNRFSAQSSGESVVGDKEPAGELKEGDYYVTPPLSELKKRGYGELAKTEGLIVGRVGYGEVEFLDAVDLTGLQKTTELLGEVVRLDDKECCVYPDIDDADKPPPGTGLNVAARITLVHCWALDKATREPIKDEKNPAAIKHLKRLKNIKNTRFESFDIEEGRWVFTVDHF